MAKNIKYLPPNDRPYERLELMGESNSNKFGTFSNNNKNGTKKYNCLEIAQNILKLNVNNSNMSDLSF